MVRLAILHSRTNAAGLPVLPPTLAARIIADSAPREGSEPTPFRKPQAP